MRFFTRAATLICVVAFALSAAAQQTSITATVPQYAGGQFAAYAFNHTEANGPVPTGGMIATTLDSSTRYTITMTAAPGSMISGFSTTVYISSAASQDITAQLVNAMPVPPTGIAGFIGGYNYMWPLVPKTQGCLTNDGAGNLSWGTCGGGGGGGIGTVTTFSYTPNTSPLSSLFTCTVTSPTSTPTLACAAAGNVAQNAVLAGPASGGAGAYSFRALTASDIPAETGDVSKPAGSSTTTVNSFNGGTPFGSAAGSAAPATVNGLRKSTGAASTDTAAVSSDIVTVLNNTPTSVLAAALFPAATSTTQGTVIEPDGAYNNKLGSLALPLQSVARTFILGTSFYTTYGPDDPETGLPNQSIGGIPGVVYRDTPGPIYPLAIGGSLCSADVLQLSSNYFPDQTYPSALFEECGENESASINANYLQNLMMYYMAWPATPYAYRITASQATVTSGSFSTYTTFPTQPGLLAGSNGTGRSVGGTTAVLTFSIPSSNTGTKVRVTYPCLTSSGGSFTLTNTTTSTNYIDNVSGTTSFSNVCPTGGTNLAPQMQEFTVPAGASTITMGTVGNTGLAVIYALDYNPPSYTVSTGTLGVANQGVVFFSTVTPYNASTQAAVNTAINAAWNAVGANGDGLPVFLSNPNVSESAGNMTAPAWVAATQTSGTATAICTASNVANHPNNCGVELLWKHSQIAQRNNHFIVSLLNFGGRQTRRDGVLDTMPSANLPGTYLDSLMWRLNNAANTFGTGFESYIYGNTRAGYSYGNNTTSGLPFSNVKVHRFWDNTGGGGLCASSVSSTIYYYTTYADALFTDNWCANAHTGGTWQTGPAMAPIYAVSMGTPLVSATTIAPTTGAVHITGTAAISTITPPTGCTTTGFSCTVTLIPDGAFTTVTGGNIALGSTAVVNRALVMTRDVTTALWYPSY